MTDGKLIVIEGSDNVGRSLHCDLLAERLGAHGIATKSIGLARSKLMGDMIKSQGGDFHIMDTRTRSLIYATDLVYQSIHDIVPMLEAGFVVIADRYTLTPEIREAVRGGDVDWIKSLYSTVPKPDVTLILHAGPRRLLNRIMLSESIGKLRKFECGTDLYPGESITTSFLNYQRVLRKKFLKSADENDWLAIPTRDDLWAVHENIWNEVSAILGEMLLEI